MEESRKEEKGMFTLNCFFCYAVIHEKRLLKNKTRYMAAPVACEWAGVVFELQKHFGRSSKDKDCRNKVKCDKPTN